MAEDTVCGDRAVLLADFAMARQHRVARDVLDGDPQPVLEIEARRAAIVGDGAGREVRLGFEEGVESFLDSDRAAFRRLLLLRRIDAARHCGELLEGAAARLLGRHKRVAPDRHADGAPPNLALREERLGLAADTKAEAGQLVISIEHLPAGGEGYGFDGALGQSDRWHGSTSMPISAISKNRETKPFSEACERCSISFNEILARSLRRARRGSARYSRCLPFEFLKERRDSPAISRSFESRAVTRAASWCCRR